MSRRSLQYYDRWIRYLWAILFIDMVLFVLSIVWTIIDFEHAWVFWLPGVLILVWCIRVGDAKYSEFRRDHFPE